MRYFTPIVVLVALAALFFMTYPMPSEAGYRSYSTTRSYSSPTKSYTSPSRTSSYKSTTSASSKMRSSSVPKSSQRMNTGRVSNAYSPSQSYQYGGGMGNMTNMLLTGAVVYAIMSSDDAEASPEQVEAVNQQFQSCVDKTGYEGTQADAAALLKSEASMTDQQQSMKDCMLPSQQTEQKSEDSEGLLSGIFGVLLTTLLAILVIALVGIVVLGGLMSNRR